MFKHLVWMLFLITCFTHKAQALVFIEPMIGYATGGSEFKYSDASDPSADGSDKPDLKGLGYGIKGGVDLLGLQLGLEYMLSDLKKSGANKEFFEPYYKESFKTTELSALLGYRFWFARLYAGYIFSAKVDKKDTGNVDFEKGTGYKVGATFYALRNLALSLEYRAAAFDSQKPSPDEKLELEYSTDQPGVFIPLPRLDLHGKLLPVRSTGFWNRSLVS